MFRMTQKTIDNILVSNEQKFLVKASQQQQQQQQHHHHHHHLHQLHSHSLQRQIAGLHDHQQLKPTFQKRIRTCYRQHQLDILEEAFKQNSYPSPAVKDLLACKTCIDVSRIQVWFQNRRAKHKKQLCQAMRSAGNTSGQTSHHLFYTGQNWRPQIATIGQHQGAHLSHQNRPPDNEQQQHQAVSFTSGGGPQQLNSSNQQLEQQEQICSFYQHENIGQQFDANALATHCDSIGQQIIQHSQDQNALSSSLAVAANFRQQYQHIQLQHQNHHHHHHQQQQQQNHSSFRQNQHFTCYHKQLGGDAKQAAGKYSSSN